MSSLKEAGRGAVDTIRHPTTPSQKHQHHDLSQTSGNPTAAQPAAQLTQNTAMKLVQILSTPERRQVTEAKEW